MKLLSGLWKGLSFSALVTAVVVWILFYKGVLHFAAWCDSVSMFCQGHAWIGWLFGIVLLAANVAAILIAQYRSNPAHRKGDFF